MAFGSILGKSKGKIELITADNKKSVLESPLQKLGLKIIGMPHTEMRMRWRIISRNLNVKRRMKILDAGCGIGLLSFEMMKKGVDITGIDISKDKIVAANRILNSLDTKNIRFLEGDITSLDFKDESFDRIICSDVLEHVKNDIGALKELSRVLKKEGEAVFTFPYINPHTARTMREFGHVRVGYDLKSFKSKIKNTRLSIVKSRGYTYFFGKIAWFFNNLSLKFPPLAALIFYPIYTLTFLDNLIKIGKPNGLFIKVKKI